jgi:hypothetical protein
LPTKVNWVSFKSVGEGCVSRRQGGVDNKADR